MRVFVEDEGDAGGKEKGGENDDYKEGGKGDGECVCGPEDERVSGCVVKSEAEDILGSHFWGGLLDKAVDFV